MKCSKCNAEVIEGTKFCPECGKSMTDATSSVQTTDVQPSKKQLTKKKGCLGCLGLILIAFLALGLIGSCAKGDTTSTKSNNQQSEQEKAAPEFKANVEGIGKIKGGISSDVGIAVAGIRETDVLGGEFHKVKAQGKFVVVKVVVYNNQKDSITVDSSCYKLKDNQDREFEVSIDGQTAIQMANGNAKGFLSKINPGLSTIIEFPFEVPKDAKGLTLKARGGFTGKEITLPLQVQKVD